MMLEEDAADAVVFIVMLRLSKPSMRVTFVDDIFPWCQMLLYIEAQETRML
jgi:hypothetical protein